MTTITRLINAARRLRLQAAEADLAFLEARAPSVIADQRARVNKLRAHAGLPLLPDSTDAIRRTVEHRAKTSLLG